jgi:hypothetical protein
MPGAMPKRGASAIGNAYLGAYGEPRQPTLETGSLGSTLNDVARVSSLKGVSHAKMRSPRRRESSWLVSPVVPVEHHSNDITDGGRPIASGMGVARRLPCLRRKLCCRRSARKCGPSPCFPAGEPNQLVHRCRVSVSPRPPQRVLEPSAAQEVEGPGDERRAAARHRTSRSCRWWSRKKSIEVGVVEANPPLTGRLRARCHAAQDSTRDYSRRSSEIRVPTAIQLRSTTGRPRGGVLAARASS